MENTAKFLNEVVSDALGVFEYYRHGPIPVPKIGPGFIFQQCIDVVLEDRGIIPKEIGLGDHCLKDLGLVVQLKTTVQKKTPNRTIFCRSSIKGASPEEQKLLRINDVENRILDVMDKSDSDQFVLVNVNLMTSVAESFNLYDGNGVIGEWLRPENVNTPFKQTHFWIKKDKLVHLSA